MVTDLSDFWDRLAARNPEAYATYTAMVQAVIHGDAPATSTHATAQGDA